MSTIILSGKRRIHTNRKSRKGSESFFNSSKASILDSLSQIMTEESHDWHGCYALSILSGSKAVNHVRKRPGKEAQCY